MVWNKNQSCVPSILYFSVHCAPLPVSDEGGVFRSPSESLFSPSGLLGTFLEIEMENRLFIHVEGQIKEINFPINLTKSSKSHSCDGRTAANVPREMSNCVRHYAPVTAESPLGLGVTVGTAVRFATAISPKDRHIRRVPECDSTPTQFPFLFPISRARTPSECWRDPSFSASSPRAAPARPRRRPP